MSVSVYDQSNKSRTKRYIVNKNGKYIISYSEGKYGKYASILADITDKTNVIFKNYYILEKDYIHMIIYSKKYNQYFDVFFDICDEKMLTKYTWCIKKDKNKKTLYCITKCNLSTHSDNLKHSVFMHRLIMNYNGELQIDHINRNGLDNRKSNLRIVTQSINQRNKSSNKTTIWTNVYKYKNDFIVNWVTMKGVRKTKCYRYTNDNYEKTQTKAIIKSIAKRAINGYILTKKDLKFIRKNKLKIIKKYNV